MQQSFCGQNHTSFVTSKGIECLNETYIKCSQGFLDEKTHALDVIEFTLSHLYHKHVASIFEVEIII
jgi:hypothetical protein